MIPIDIVQNCAYAEHQPKSIDSYPSIIDVGGKYPIIINGYNEVTFWVEIDDFDVIALSDIGNLYEFGHSLTYYMEGGTLSELIDFPIYDPDYKKQLNWFLENGIIPNQPFQISVYVSFYTSKGYFDIEGEWEYWYEILYRTPLETSKIIDFFKDFIDYPQ